MNTHARYVKERNRIRMAAWGRKAIARMEEALWAPPTEAELQTMKKKRPKPKPRY